MRNVKMEIKYAVWGGYPVLFFAAAFFAVIFCFLSPVLSAGVRQPVVSDPCAENGALLSILDRPTVSDSSCVVKPGKVVIEAGMQDFFFNNQGVKSEQVAYPYAEIRAGLPGNNEIKFFPPNYNILTYPGFNIPPSSGYDDSGIGFKHEFGYTQNLTYSADVLVAFPSGTNGFQNYGTDFTVNGQFTYSLTDALSVQFAPGISSLTALSGNGNPRRFFSFNPDFVAAYQFTSMFQLYGELFRNSIQGVGLSGNYWFDGGFQYLITNNIEIDAEYGVFLDPPSGSSGHYIGFGTGLMF